jgi:hypothetical protein
MTVGEMLTRMTAREYDDWKRFAKHEPFGDRRGDVQAATVASAAINATRGKGAPIGVDAFLPDYDPPPTAEEQAAKAEEAARIAAWQAAARAQRKQA